MSYLTNNIAPPSHRQIESATLNYAHRNTRRSLVLKLFTLVALVLTFMFLGIRLTPQVSAATRALVPEIAGIHFISFTTWHLGDGGAGALPGTYAGQTKIFDITANDYDATKHAIITMRVKEVNSPCNQVMFESMNAGEDDQTVHVANPIPNHTEDLSDWHTVTLEIPANTFQAASTKRLWITARNNDCGWNGGLDDFLVDTIVLHYVRK